MERACHGLKSRRSCDDNPWDQAERHLGRDWIAGRNQKSPGMGEKGRGGGEITRRVANPAIPPLGKGRSRKRLSGTGQLGLGPYNDHSCQLSFQRSLSFSLLLLLLLSPFANPTRTRFSTSLPLNFSLFLLFKRFFLINLFFKENRFFNFMQFRFASGSQDFISVLAVPFFWMKFLLLSNIWFFFFWEFFLINLFFEEDRFFNFM